MPEIPIPATDESLTTDDPLGSAMTVVMLVVGFAIAIGAAVFGERLWNLFAGNTPETEQVEVF